MQDPDDVPAEAGSLVCEVHPDGEAVLRLALLGELDVATAPLLEEALMAAACQEPEVLLIDLRGLTFLGVAGLRVMLAACQEGARTRVSIVAGPPPVMRLFELTGLDSRLEIVDTA